MELLDSTFRFNSPVLDQTLGTLTESAIEFILRKQADDGAAS
jgi:hypothetical protein